MNIKKKEQQIFKSDIKSGNIIEINSNNYYLIIDASCKDKFNLYNLTTYSTVYGDFTQEELYRKYNITTIYANSDLILK